MTDPDIYSNAWYRKQFAGISFAVHQACAEYVSADERIEALKSRVESLETALTDAQAEIGKLRGEFEEKIELIRESYRKLKNGSLPDA